MKNSLCLSLVFLSLITACSSGGQVVVRSEPVGAEVFILDPQSGSSALLGQTPVAFNRSAYAKKENEVIQLRIEKTGFQSRTPAVAAYGSGTTYLDVEMSPLSVAKSEIRDSFEKVRSGIANANRLASGGRYPEALSELERVIELDPKNAEAFAAKGSVLYLMRDLEQAQKAWNRALEINPQYESVRTALIEMNLSARKPASQGSKGN